ncbi:MAG: transporter substrate-binding domain-containing protein, partial [Comamonas testosteroni]|uniref:transporter substrate-binding domain-containing protein n=1 Tax=Comamonas testosteroni TaxID=285 RepID=UPI003D0B9D88
MLTPVPRQALSEVRVTLTQPERQWLAQKQLLVVGVLNDPLPPFRIFVEGQRLEGLVADYVSALQRELGVPVQLRAFDARGDMYAALRDGRIDMVSNVNAFMAKSNGWVLSAPYTLAQLALFSEGGDLHEYSTTDGKTRIAVANGMMLELFESVGGRGRFQQYSSPLLAMASVLNGENDVFLGDTLSSEYLSSQLFSNQFVINQSAKLPEVQAGFGLLPDSTLLAGVLGRALGGLTRCQIVTAQHLWGGTEDCSVSDLRSRLSPQELDWLERNETVELVVSEDLAPFAFFNSRGRLNGIASDVLDIIRRKTGMRLKIRRVSSL